MTRYEANRTLTHHASRITQRALPSLLLVALVALFLFPYVFQGRSMLPLELIPVFQPWASHARELWAAPPAVHNALLDALQQYYPRRVYMAQALRAGWLPLWDTYLYGGSPFLAMQQGAVLYPPAWFLALIPPELQFGWSALFHLSLAALGAFFFFRELALRPIPALAGATAFAFNGFVIVWLAYPNVTQWTLCWLPPALFLWERGSRRDDLRWLALCGLTLGLCLLGGHGQSSAYVLVTWGAWALFRGLLAQRPLRALGRWVALPAALGLALSMGHLLPALDFVPRTDRGDRVTWRAVVEAGMPLSQLWTFLLPRLFGDATDAYSLTSWLPLDGKAGLAFIERSFYPGVSVLVLAAGAAALPRQATASRRLAGFSLALSVAAVLLAMGSPLYWPLWEFAPGFSHFTAVARIVCLAGWGLACLAALGTHALTSAERATRVRAFRAMALAAGLGLALALIATFIYGDAAPPSVTEFLSRQGRPSVTTLAARELLRAILCLILPAVLAGLTLVPRPEGSPDGATGRPRRRGDGATRQDRPLAPSPRRLGRPVASAYCLLPTGIGAALVAVVVADLFAFGAGFNPAADPRLLKAEPPELAALRALPEPARFLSTGPRGREMDVRERMPSNLPATYGLADISGSDSFVTLRYREWEAALAKVAGGAPWEVGAPSLRSAAVRYYLLHGAEPPPAFRSLSGAAVFEDTRALPYARLHTRAQTLPAPQLLAALADPARDPTTALLEGPGAPSFDGPAAVIPFQAARLNGNHLALTGTATAPGVLVVCEQFDPGWRARVDGAPARLFPADHLFVGIPLAAGPHRVELTYAPDVFRAGLFGSMLGVAWLCGLLVAGGRRSREDRRSSLNEARISEQNAGN